MSQRYQIQRLGDLAPTDCSCGQTRRAFVDDPAHIASLHVVDISRDARVHYHKRHTEIYYVLDGKGEIELDGTRHAIRSGDAILIKPGCRHRAIGRLRILNASVPTFDPSDEWFDE